MNKRQMVAELISQYGDLNVASQASKFIETYSRAPKDFLEECNGDQRYWSLLNQALNQCPHKFTEQERLLFYSEMHKAMPNIPDPITAENLIILTKNGRAVHWIDGEEAKKLMAMLTAIHPSEDPTYEEEEVDLS